MHAKALSHKQKPGLALWLLLLAVLPRLAAGQSPPPGPALLPLDRLPSWALPAVENTPFAKHYDLSLHLNPFYLSGDFDGDHRPDLAVLVRERATGKAGIAIVRGTTEQATVLGAGHAFGPGDDWRWMNLWRVETRVSATLNLPKRGDLLLALKPDSVGGMVWWDGDAWRWTDLGD